MSVHLFPLYLKHIKSALTFEIIFSFRKLNPTHPITVKITSNTHHSTIFSHVITILPASVMGEYFERPNVTIIPPNSILSIKKIKKKPTSLEYIMKLNNLTFSDRKMYH